MTRQEQLSKQILGLRVLPRDNHWHISAKKRPFTDLGLQHGRQGKESSAGILRKCICRRSRTRVICTQKIIATARCQMTLFSWLFSAEQIQFIPMLFSDHLTFSLLSICMFFCYIAILYIPFGGPGGVQRANVDACWFVGAINDEIPIYSPQHAPKLSFQRSVTSPLR